eukprot:9812-Pyramimonas_sp.AAC.1
MYNKRLHHSLLSDHLLLDLVPVPSRVGRLFRGVKRRKAPGQDQMSGDLLTAHPAALARHYAPIFVKTSMRQQEALASKHGIVFPLFKGKGTPTCLDNYRSILLNGTISKRWHRLLRDQLAHYLHLMLKDTQCGGRSQRGPAQLLHLMTTFIQA